MKVFMKRLTALTLAVSMLCAMLSGCAFGKKSITVYAEGDYIDPNLIAAFTEETGVEVKYIVGGRTPTAEEKAAYAHEQGLTDGDATYYTDADAVMEDKEQKKEPSQFDGMSLREILFSSRHKKLKTEPISGDNVAAYAPIEMETGGNAKEVKFPTSAYDVILTDSSTITELAGCDLLTKLDEELIPNSKSIDPEWKLDDYSVTCLWETMGLLWNTSLVENYQSRWASLQDAAYAGRLLMPDNQRDCIAIALNALGYDVNTEDPDQIQEAYDFLVNQKNLVYSYTEREAYPLMENGLAAIMPCYSGDALYMMQRNSDLVFAIPAGGTFRISFGYCIPADTKMSEEAAAFVNYMCATTNMAKNAVYCKYSLTAQAAVVLLDNSWHTNPLAYPPAMITENAELMRSVSPEQAVKNHLFWETFTAVPEEEAAEADAS